MLVFVALILSQFLLIEKGKLRYNTNDSRFYFPIMDMFKIKLSQGEAITQPEAVIVGAGFYTREIREYDQERNKDCNPVNVINRRKNKSERIIGFDKVLFKKRRSIERLFSHIEAYKKIYPRHEQREDSYLGLVQMVCALIIWEKVLVSSHNQKETYLTIMIHDYGRRDISKA